MVAQQQQQCNPQWPRGEERIHTFKDLSIAIQRALVRFKAFHAHERRAAHEAKIMEMLLRDLKVDGCIIVADWKVRESNSQRHEPV